MSELTMGQSRAIINYLKDNPLVSLDDLELYSAEEVMNSPLEKSRFIEVYPDTYLLNLQDEEE